MIRILGIVLLVINSSVFAQVINDSIVRKYYNQAKYTAIPIWYKNYLNGEILDITLYKGKESTWDIPFYELFLLNDTSWIKSNTKKINTVCILDSIFMKHRGIDTCYIMLHSSEQNIRNFSKYNYSYTIMLGALLKKYIIGRKWGYADKLIIIGCENRFWNKLKIPSKYKKRENSLNFIEFYWYSDVQK